MELHGASHENEFEGMTQKKSSQSQHCQTLPRLWGPPLVTTINGVTHPCPAPKPLTLLKKQKQKINK